MLFKLDIDRRNLSDDDLLQDVKAVARRLSLLALTVELYNKHGTFDASTIIRRFGSWRSVLVRCGLDVVHNNGGIDDQEALADLKRVAASLNRDRITGAEYDNLGRYSKKKLAKAFGSWNKALLAAGLVVNKRHKIPDEELFENLERMWRELGRQPSYSEIQKPFSRFAAGTYESRFGGWRKALEAFVEVVNADSPVKPADEVELPVLNVETLPSPRANRKGPRKINWRLRFLTLQRDGFRCQSCGRSPANTLGVILHVDHVIPWSKNGETVLENLETKCEVCNIGKSDQLEE